MLAVDCYVVVTWLPPLDLDPFLSFPVSQLCYVLFNFNFI